MFWIILARAAIWATFLLLIVAVIAGMVWTRKFYVFYMREHKKLQVEIDAIKRHTGMPLKDWS